MQRVSTAKLSLLIDGVERWAEVTHAYLEHTVLEEESFDGFPVQSTLFWTLHVQAIQSLDEGSLWRLLWDDPAGWVDITYAPAGNEVPTDNAPHFRMRARKGPRPNIGGSAQLKGSQSFETAFRCERFVTPTTITSI